MFPVGEEDKRSEECVRAIMAEWRKDGSSTENPREEQITAHTV